MGPHRFIVSVLTAVVIAGTISLPVLAQEDADESPIGDDAGGWADLDSWEFEIAPYGWFAQVDGDMEVAGRTVGIDVEFKDLLEVLDFGGMVYAEARHGPWTLFVDAAYLKASDDVRLRGPGPIGLQFGLDAEVEMAIVQFGAAYRVFERGLDVGGADRRVFADVLGGGRYWYFKTTIDPLNLPDFDKTVDWVEPNVGARAGIDLTDTLTLSAHGDIGAFGIGEAPELTWLLQGLLSYRLNDTWSLHGGYRVLDVDVDDSRTDIQMRGPIVGVSFRF